jgi:hypothetical protein
VGRWTAGNNAGRDDADSRRGRSPLPPDDQFALGCGNEQDVPAIGGQEDGAGGDAAQVLCREGLHVGCHSLGGVHVSNRCCHVTIMRLRRREVKEDVVHTARLFQPRRVGGPHSKHP